MKSRTLASVAGSGLVACLLLAPSTASAHFNLMEPKPSDKSASGGKGGPPCGVGAPTTDVTEVEGGKMLTIKLMETVYHAGHYRVSLSANLADLMSDPEVTKKTNGDSMSAKIQMPPVLPVIADGMSVHTKPINGVQMFDVMIPNIDCPKCTLQVIEFMADHGAPYFYHHCAILKVTKAGGGGDTPDAGTPDASSGTGGASGNSGGAGGSSTGSGGASASGGSSGSTGGSSGSGGSAGSSGTSGGSSGSSGGASGSGGSSSKGGSNGSSGGASGSSDEGGGSSGGCSMGGSQPSGATLGLLALLGLALARGRRRR
jgi:MYXO-CTERM domain-containing protein